MDTSHTVRIHGEFDLITARSRVRELATQMGFGTIDKVCISLVTWLTAQRLALDAAYEGLVTVSRVDNGPRSGIRVMCDKNSASAGDLLPATYYDIRWMVDELDVEPLPNDGIRVTLVKWLPRMAAEGL